MTTNPRIKAWHFTTDTLRDGRPIPEIGATLSHVGPIEICSSGLHASKRLRNAIGYAPSGSTKLHRVVMWGDVEEHDDKFVARHRRILATIPAQSFLREFAREVALEALLSHFPGQDTLTGADEEDYALCLTYLASGDDELRSEAYSAGWRLRDSAWNRYWAARAAAAAWSKAYNEALEQARAFQDKLAQRLLMKALRQARAEAPVVPAA